MPGANAMNRLVALIAGLCATADAATGNGIEESPTWRVVVFLFLFLLISVLLEHFFHYAEQQCMHHGQTGIVHAIHKIKEELMLLGFISLLLLVIEEELTSICVSNSSWKGIPCPSHTVGDHRRRHLPTRRLLAEEEEKSCAEGQDTFLDINAMHQVHIMIFLIAVCHVFLSLLCLVLAQHRINKWTDWEFWGDDEDETIERLQPPRKYNSRAWKLTNFFAQQFTNAVDPFSYIAFRRFFLSKNNLKGNFVYKDILLESLQSDFKMVVGISSWMWFTVIFHVIGESYGFGHLYIPGICSLVMTCTAGTKMIANLSEISMGVMLLYDDEADGKIEQSDLDRIQNEDQSADRVAGLETDFWFDDPTLLMQVVRLALFEAALIIGESIFYRWQVGTKACFFDERGRWLAIFVCVVAVLLVVLLGTVTVPLYAVICTAGVHKLPEEEAMQLFDSLERKKELIAHYRELGLLKAAAKEEEKARSARRRSGTASRGEQRSEESDVDAQDSTPNRDACGVGSENMKLRPVVANHKVNSVVPISHDGTESMDLNPSTQAVMVEDY